MSISHRLLDLIMFNLVNGIGEYSTQNVRYNVVSLMKVVGEYFTQTVSFNGGELNEGDG